jgi:hypothetical protein
MAFLNNHYTNEPYYTSQKAIKAGKFTYLIDKYVTKTDLNGNIIFRKEYRSDNGSPLTFFSITKCENSDLILLGRLLYSNNLFFVIRIDSNGKVLWSKNYQTVSYFGTSDQILSKLNGENYIVYAGVSSNDNGLKDDLIKIDGNGTILARKALKCGINPVYLRNLNTIGNQIVLMFNKLIDNPGNNDFFTDHIICIILDVNLNEVNRFGLKADKKMFLSSSYIKNNELILYGEIEMSQDYGYLRNFITKIPLNNPPQSNQSHTLKLIENLNGGIIYNTGSHYMGFSDDAIFYSFQRTFIRLDYHFNIQWVKRIGTYVGSFLVFHQVIDDRLVFTDNNFSLYGLLNLNLDSCETEVGDPMILQDYNVNFKGNFSFTIEESNVVITETFVIAENVASLTVVKLCPELNEEIPLVLGAAVAMQSPHLYLQASGSQGLDSTKGFHLRWMLKNALEAHLPKGDYATTSANFNKPDDYVKIYRVPYVKKGVLLNFTTQIPSLINDRKAFWVYNLLDYTDESATVQKNYVIHFHFKDKTKYNQTRLLFNPLTNPFGFLQSYGNGLIEIETKTELSFAVTSHFSTTDAAGSIKVELLAVEDTKITAPKGVSLRKTYTTLDINNKKLVGENIRSIRFVSNNTTIESLEFEFYSDFIKKSDFVLLDKYALTLDINLAFSRLEAQVQSVNNKWLRYNDAAKVNIENYKAKWNTSPELEERIEYIVNQYITLSDDANNEMANEEYNFNENITPTDDYNPIEDSKFIVSNLNVLQISSLDYHIARMLGLGMLDVDSALYDGTYVYLAEYFTFGDLEDGKGPREVQHIYCSLPTSILDERLPLPIDIKEIKYGIFYGLDTDSPTLLTDEQGYSIDGQTRFLSIFHQPIEDEALNTPFFTSTKEFVSADYTNPVHAGIEYRNVNQPQWEKPELTYDKEYFNIDTTVASNKANESIPIILPDAPHPLFVHREKEEGTHYYNSYGINWFSRATRSVLPNQEINTIFPPVNTLLPPTNVNALLIREEDPLFLTTAAEQLRLSNISDAISTDKTLIRLTFDYNHVQELKNYHKLINGQFVNGYVEVPDTKELFAENIHLFYRNQIPNVISGKIAVVEDDPENEILAIVKTAPYAIISSGNANEQIIPSFPSGLQANFIGSVLLIDKKEFIVQESYTGSNGYPEFKVLKRDESQTSLSTESNPEYIELESPVTGGMFIVVENMATPASWGANLPMNFKVTIDHQITTIHHEEYSNTAQDGVNNETFVQKFRGVYQDALIEKFYEPVDIDNDGVLDVQPNQSLVEKHLGFYKITFQNNGTLLQHSQFNQDNFSVEWYNGVVRLHTLLLPEGERKEFKVVRTENLGSSTQPLILYILDATFPDKPWEPYDAQNPTGPTKIDIYAGKLIDADDAIKSTNQKVNYYPGYKVYLYKDAVAGLTKEKILPAKGEKERYSIFGLRSHDNGNPFDSKLSTPALLFAQEINPPRQPELPVGGKYATRPDFYGKSTYTFNTVFKHNPYAIQFNRASDVQILSSIYDIKETFNNEGILIPSTYDYVKKEIFKDGEDDYFVNRWNHLLGFNYDYPTEDIINQNGNFKKYPDTSAGIALPFPDSPVFIESINAFVDEHNTFYKNVPFKEPNITGITDLNKIIIRKVNLPDGRLRNGELKIKDFIKDIIHNCFVPLTEVPVVYEYIKTEAIHNYVPIAKKQVVRDRNGNLLKPSDADFDMGPMMVVKKPNPNGTPKVKENEVQFTDFGLDGASNANYFYAVREFDLQMKTGEYSEMMGPIRLVNTEPPTAPEIIKIIPILENRTLGIEPAIQLEINAYSKAQKIRKINLYRASTKLDSLSIRTMKLVKRIDLEDENLLDSNQWQFKDDFSDLGYVPFSDPLFYAITVSRVIEYNDRDGNQIIDYAPSEASNVVLTNTVENYSPESPVVKYASEPIKFSGDLNFITLFWDESVYKGNYHLYKMNSQGNWIEIAQINSDKLNKELYHVNTKDSSGLWVEKTTITPVGDVIYLHLESTNLDTNYLKTKSEDGSTIYHHFKIIAENTSGMFSSEENILSIYNTDSWNDLGGIDDMIIGRTFIIRGDGLGRLAVETTFEIQ